MELRIEEEKRYPSAEEENNDIVLIICAYVVYAHQRTMMWHVND